jgi:two-component system cell cycle response regulator
MRGIAWRRSSVKTEGGLNAPEMFSAHPSWMKSDTEDRPEFSPKRILKSGRIVFNDRHSVIDCVVREMSAKGARLMVISVLGIPESFDLQVGDDRRAARVVWKSANSLGVEFAKG